MFVSGSTSAFVGAQNTYYEASNNAWDDTAAGIGVGKLLKPQTVYLTDPAKSTPYSNANNLNPIKQVSFPAGGEQGGADRPWKQGIWGRYWMRGGYFDIQQTVTRVTIGGEKSVGLGIRCVTDAMPSWYGAIDYHVGTDEHFIYLSADGKSLQLGKWGREITNINQIVLFQFGSLVGLSNPEVGDPWSYQDGSDIVFNPTSFSNFDLSSRWTNDGVGSMPNYASAHGAGFNYNIPTDGSVSNINVAYGRHSPTISNSGQYHIMKNIKAGKGDACRIAGLTIDEIKAAATVEALDALQKSKLGANYRTPTIYEAIRFIGGPSATTWRIGETYPIYYNSGYSYYKAGTAPFMSTPSLASVPITNTAYATKGTFTLPASHARDYRTGETIGIYNAWYWSANMSYTYRFSDSMMESPTGNSIFFGFAMRCVER